MNALTTTLKQLRLSGLIQTLDVRLQEAAAKGRLNFIARRARRRRSP